MPQNALMSLFKEFKKKILIKNITVKYLNMLNIILYFLINILIHDVLISI